MHLSSSLVNDTTETTDECIREQRTDQDAHVYVHTDLHPLILSNQVKCQLEGRKGLDSYKNSDYLY